MQEKDLLIKIENRYHNLAERISYHFFQWHHYLAVTVFKNEMFAIIFIKILLCNFKFKNKGAMKHKIYLKEILRKLSPHTFFFLKIMKTKLIYFKNRMSNDRDEGRKKLHY